MNLFETRLIRKVDGLNQLRISQQLGLPLTPKKFENL